MRIYYLIAAFFMAMLFNGSSFSGDYQSQTLIIANWGKADGEFGLILEAEGNCPQSLSVDASGNIAILDLVNKRVQIYSSEGKWLGKFSITSQAFDIQYADGQIILLAPYDYVLEQYDLQGRLIKKMTIDRELGFLDGLRASNQKVYIQTIEQTQYDIADLSLAKALPSVSPGVSAHFPDLRFHTQWLDDHRGNLFIENIRTGGKQTIPITTQDELGSIVFLDADRYGNIFLRKELFDPHGHSYFAVDKLDDKGNLMATVSIPNINVVAPFKPITIDREGNIYFLSIESERFSVIRWQSQK